MSIFKEYYSEQVFVDRFENDASNAIDVIIPVFHTNELWRANLISIYREVPVRRLLISDGGVIDDSIEIVSEFPRVEVLNHRHYKSLGKCIAELIKAVTSEWFIYLHSDVYLPEGWFNTMISHNSKFDWYGCPMNITVLTNYKLVEPLRPYAGSQIGRKAAFEKGIDVVEDDYVYRQEDFVFNRIVEDAGYKTGKVEDTFHYHQLMFRKSAGLDLNIKRVSVETNVSDKERLRTQDTQLRGIVKYLNPDEEYVIADFKWHVNTMLANKLITYNTFSKWIKLHNPLWIPYFNRKTLTKIYISRAVQAVKIMVKKLIGM
jgi:hypothetical protein